MAEQVTVHAEFDYRGKTHQVSAVIALDVLLQSGEYDFNVLGVLAAANGIDPYSYEFEVMQQAELRYDDAQGLAAKFVQAGQFDVLGYAAARHRQGCEAQLLRLAQPALGLCGEPQRETVLAALRQAFVLGWDAALRADPAARSPVFPAAAGMNTPDTA